MTQQKIKIKDLNFNELQGKRYKGWKQFCEENNLSYNRNMDFINNQKKELQRFTKVKWIGKDKREFIIKEIYEQVKPNTSTKGKDGRFSNYLEYLLPFLPQNEYLSMNEILKGLGLLDTKFITFKYDEDKCIHEIMRVLDKPHFGKKEYNDKILMDIMNHFFRHSDFIKNVIKLKLEKLHKDGVINLKIKTMISDAEGYHMATLSELFMIEEAENMALEIMGYSNLQEVYLKNEFEKFYAKVISLLEENEMMIDYYYPIYNFSYVSKRRGRAPSENTIDKKKQEFKQEYIKKIHELIDNDSSKKTIEYLKNKSRGYISSEKITRYEHKICDFLLSNKPLREK